MHKKHMLRQFSVLLTLALLCETGCSDKATSNSGSTDMDISASPAPESGDTTNPGGWKPDKDNRPGFPGDSSQSDDYTQYATLTVDTELNVGKYDDGSGFVDMTETAVTLSDSGFTVNGDGAEATGSLVTITSEGVYRLTGSTAEGQLVINASSDAHIRLILDNVTMSSTKGSPILIENAKKVLITLADGTTNSITDATPYSELTTTASTEDSSSETTDENASAPAGIFSRDDLTIGGTGTLVITGATNGIVCKDKLKLLDGTLKITAGNNAVRGKECVAIYGGTYEIKSGNDGIKSYTNSEETCGFVLIEGGSVEITADDDGIHGEYLTRINGGSLTITAKKKAIRSDYHLEINGGEYQILSSYEGLESPWILLSGGKGELHASDDGININCVEKGFGGRPGEFMTGAGNTKVSDESNNSTNVETGLFITGGELLVYADGDGLDSNSNITMSGGDITVYGPLSNNNGALDYAGTFTMTGGTLLASGSSGMAQSVTPDGLYSLMVQWSQAVAAGTTISLQDASGKTVWFAAPEKNFSNLVLCTPELSAGKYALYTGNTKSCDFTIGNASTAISSDGSAITGGGFGGHGGRPGRRDSQ